MRRLFGFLVFVAIVIVAVGFWRGWFVVNQAKLDHDEQKLERKFEHVDEKIKEGAKNVEEKTNN
jgi:hypothetical protein